VSIVAICNRALQKLGAARITALTDDSRNARACSACYEAVRDAELRVHPWSFAVKRAQLAAETTAPAFDYDYQYTWPTDALRILPPNDANLDWQQEGRMILSNEAGPLDVRYVARITDTNLFDALFNESLAAKMAMEMCEDLTQSNTKAEKAGADYRNAIREAKKVNAFEKISEDPPEDGWVSARR